MRSLYLSLLYGMCGATWKILMLVYDVVMSCLFSSYLDTSMILHDFNLTLNSIKKKKKKKKKIKK
jgi:hypothetical protein